MFLFLDNVFDPTQKILIACISNGDHESDVFDLRGDLKSLESETNSKRNEIKLINEYEDGLKTNIRKLEAIISVKVLLLKLYYTQCVICVAFTLYCY